MRFLVSLRVLYDVAQLFLKDDLLLENDRLWHVMALCECLKTLCKNADVFNLITNRHFRGSIWVTGAIASIMQSQKCNIV